MLITFRVGTFSGSCSLYVPGRADTDCFHYNFPTMGELKKDWMEAKQKLPDWLEGPTVIKEFRRSVEASECHLDRDQMNNAFHFIILEEISQVFLRADLERHFKEKREQSRLRLDSGNVSDARSISSITSMSSPTTSVATAVSPDIYDIMNNVPEDEYDPLNPLDEDEDELMN